MTNSTTTESDEALNRRLRCAPLTWAELQSIVLSPDIDDLSKLARSIEQQRYYRKCRQDIKIEWQSIYDYLLCKKFGFEWVWVEHDDDDDHDDDVSSKESDGARKKRSNPTFQEYLNNQQQHQSKNGGKNISAQFNLCTNDFPYFFEAGVQHFVLWKLGGVVTADEIVKAKLDIAKHTSISQLQSWDVNINCWSLALDQIDGTGSNKNNLEMANDHEVFLHWVNPPHLKSLPGIDHVHILFRGEGNKL